MMEPSLNPFENSAPVKDTPQENIRKVTGHWLTRKPAESAHAVAAASLVVLFLATFLFWDDVGDMQSWATAIPQKVFEHHEYWRIWTALLVHGDAVHLLSNSILFSIFAYLLYAHFGTWLFPLAAVFFGGVTNVIVLKTLPPETQLMGISGVIYWMGAVWLTLYFCLESRDKFFRRALKALGVGAVLFAPETFHASVSYLSHFVGFILGVLWGLIYYLWNRPRFLAAEKFEMILTDSLHDEM